jgi:hypothetical protein
LRIQLAGLLMGRLQEQETGQPTVLTAGGRTGLQLLQMVLQQHTE